MYFVYNLLFSLIFILLFPYLFLRGLFGRHGVWQRLGKVSFPKNLSSPLIWLHSASVGEVKALATILPKLKKLKPELSLVVSVLTKTGKKQAQESLSQADFIFYLPVDIPFILRKVFKKLNPALLVLVETEFWPNLIREAKKNGAKICLINGRISPKSFKRYNKIKSFSKSVLSYFDFFLMQTQAEAQRLWDLGGEQNKTVIVGNLKFDRTLLGIDHLDQISFKRNLNLSVKDKLIIAGSTHAEEERIVLSVFKRLKEKHKELILLLAPRHLSRISEIEELLLQFKFAYVKKSTKKVDRRAEIILLDTMGELETLYGIAEFAFVGGSLVPKGGHNILEPASYGIPVLFGPFMDNFKTAAELLMGSKGGIMVKDEEELYREAISLLEDEALRRKLGLKAKETLLSHTGTSDKTVKLLLDLLSRENEVEKK